MSEIATLSAEEAAALVGGFHGDPFATLGPHEFEGGMVVRTFQPHAPEVFLQLTGQKDPLPMIKIHEEGLFERVVPDPTEPFVYQLELRFPTDKGEIFTQTIEDPYRYWPTIDSTDKLWYDFNGAHPAEIDGVSGVRFAVWAPNGQRVSVVGTFNDWDGRRHAMRKHLDSGMWDIFIPGVEVGALYKFEIKTPYKGYMVTKTDPAGFFSEMRPKNASIVWDIEQYAWQDQDWLARRASADKYRVPISIYEVHLGSWRRKGEDGREWLTYHDLVDQLIPYAKEMGYTHIELLPITEHPFDGSWGYQVTGYFAPTSRFGTPDDFKYFVDQCHQNGLGVILDWVPAHFPKDEFGLGFFDGTYLYEHADPRQGEHPDWGTKIFNYGRPEVKKFLIDNALFWVDKYHIDGLRVDAVASMLYLDFSREPGEWVPNRYGGRENIEAIDFLRDFNRAVHKQFPGVYTFAEESTAWPGVTRDPDEGGLGFDIKWNMGWMNDTLRYVSTDPIFRSFHQGTLTFSLLYAFSERFVLPFSHDEVVHLKRAMVDKMPGDSWQKFANLRALFAYQYAHPGRKLNFMGNEIGQWREWQETVSLDWHLLEQGPFHKGTQELVKDLNHIYLTHKPLYMADEGWEGFTWIDFRDALHSVFVFMRIDPETKDHIIVAANLTPEARIGYRIGVANKAGYRELLNTDDSRYGGSGVTNDNILESFGLGWQDQPYSTEITLPPLGVVYLKPIKDDDV